MLYKTHFKRNNDQYLDSGHHTPPNGRNVTSFSLWSWPREISRRGVLAAWLSVSKKDSAIESIEKRDRQWVKERGRTLFDLARGGSYAVFDQRPMDPEVVEYCA